MFASEGGMFTFSGTEKQSPCACPSPWYGSCPSSTTFVAPKGHNSNAWKMNAGEGKTFAERYSPRTNSANPLKYGFSNSSFRISFQDGSILIIVRILLYLQKIHLVI